MERELLRYCKCNGKVTFTRPFMTVGKVAFDEHVILKVLERYCEGDNYVIPIAKAYKHFSTTFCDSTLGNFDVSP